MREPTILPVTLGAISKSDRAILHKAGVIVIECDNPREIRLIRAHAEIDSSTLLTCALKALMHHESGYGGSSGAQQREAFTRLVSTAIAGWPENKPKGSEPKP